MILEMRNLGKCRGITEQRFTERIEKMDERNSSVQNMIEEKSKSKILLKPNIQKI